MLGSVRATSGGTSTPIINTAQVLTAASSIAITASVASQVCPVSAASSITLTSNPQIATGINGQQVKLVNTGSTTITFADANGLSLQGTLALGSTQWAIFENLGGFWQLGSTNGSTVWSSVSFLNSYANTAGGFQLCEYTKFQGVVECRGVATKTGATAAVFNLPAGFRPSSFVRFSADSISHPGTDTMIQVAPGGDAVVIISGTLPASHTISFSSVRFRI
jgi:hypothetical protein